MAFLLSAVLLNVFGAIALKKSSTNGELSSFTSVAGYICYILSFACLDYAMFSVSIITVFSVWAAGSAIFLLTIGVLFFDDQLDTAKFISALATVIGMVGLAISSLV